MYLLLLILLLGGGFLVYALIRLIQRENQAQRRYEAYRNYIMAYGSEKEKESLMIGEMEDLIPGIGGLVMLDMMDRELGGDFDLVGIQNCRNRFDITFLNGVLISDLSAHRQI